MELKRYVLLENKEIIKTNEKQYICTIDNCLYTKVDDWIDSKVSGYTATKTSDNILDLVEVGDLVEDKDGAVLQFYEWWYHDDDKEDCPSWIRLGNPKRNVHTTRWYTNEIVAIYKRQPNGDYKRYLV